MSAGLLFALHQIVGISVFDEVNSDVLCPSVVVDGEDGDVAVVDNVVSSVEPLSNVDDSNVDDVKEDIAVVICCLSCRYRFCFCCRPKLSGLCLLACCLLCTRCRYFCF